jgi:hypothetical protein
MIRILWPAVSGPDVRLDIKRICPADMIRAPADKTMEESIRLVIGAYRYTEGTGRIAFGPVHTTCFSIDRPLQFAAHIGYIVGLGGPIPTNNGLRGAFLRTYFTGLTKFRDAKFNRLVRNKGQIGNYIV